MRYTSRFFYLSSLCCLAFAVIIASCAPAPAHAGQREKRNATCQLVAQTAATTQRHRRDGHSEEALRAALQAAIEEAGVEPPDSTQHLAALAAAFSLPEQYGPQAVGQEVYNACMLDKA